MAIASASAGMLPFSHWASKSRTNAWLYALSFNDGGNLIQTGRLEWVASSNFDAAAQVNLQYSTNGGADWSGIATVAATNESYAWTAPGEYDFSQLDERALMLLKENPNAYFFPRLYLHAPKWWSETHPDDIVLMDPGDGKVVPFIHSGGKPAPSWRRPPPSLRRASAS